MKIKQTYKYRKDGIVYVSGKLPEGAEVIETMDILVAEEGYYLVRISDEKKVGSSILLRNGDVQENYKEEVRKDTEDKDA